MEKRGLLIVFFFIMFLVLAVNVRAGCPDNIKITSDGNIEPSSADSYFEIDYNNDIYKLKQDLTDCVHDGIEIYKDGATLDCQGYKIHGDGESGSDSDWGVKIKADDVTVRACDISKFHDGGGIVVSRYSYNPLAPWIKIKRPVIEFNKIHSNPGGAWGIAFAYVDGQDESVPYPRIISFIRFNKLRSNRDGGISISGSQYQKSKNIKVEYNTLEYNGVKDDTDGIHIGYAEAGNIVIAHNYIDKSGDDDYTDGEGFDIYSTDVLTSSSGFLPQLCNKVKIAGTEDGTPSNWCDETPYNDHAYHCRLDDVCSPLDPDERLLNYDDDPKITNIPSFVSGGAFCNAMAYIDMYYPEHSCVGKAPNYRFCADGDVYNCIGCGGFNIYQECGSAPCSNGQCITCSDSDGGYEPEIFGTCIDTSPHPDECIDSNTLREWQCDGETCISDEYSCEGGCYEGRCLCELSYVEFSPLDCPTEGCNIENEISITAIYEGCEEVENIQIPVKGGSNPDCNFVISSFCDPMTGGCAGTWIIPTVPEACIGETIFFDETKTAAIYDKDEVEIAETSNVGGEFKFIGEGALTLQYIDLWPEDKTIEIEETIDYHIDAFYKDTFGQIIKKEVTWDFYAWTDYTSSDYDVATNIEVVEYIYTFKGLSQDYVTITGYFPIDLIERNKENWTETDTTGLNVEEPNDCSIISLEIPLDQPGCGSDGKCVEGEKIDINLGLHSLCRNNYAKKIIIDFKDMEANTQCKFQAENNNISFGNEGSCVYEGGIYECELKWEIPSGFFEDNPECNGVKATAHFAELFNNINNFLDSKQGEPPDYFGSFQFWTENIPPIARIIKPIGQGGIPVNSIPGYAPNEEVPFRDGSTDEDGIIIKWDWYYRLGLGEWILLNHFTQQNYEQEFTKSFDLPGTYQAKLNVEDDENAVDEDMKNFVITDGEAPIIIPDSPDSNIIQSREVLLNVSDSYDPPIEYKEDKTRLGDFYWEFNDDSVPGTFRDNWTYASDFIHILTNAQELYEFNLTLYDKDSPPNLAYYQFVFKTWHCIDNNNLVFADGSSESCLSNQPDYCSSSNPLDPTQGIAGSIPNCQVCGCPGTEQCLPDGQCNPHNPQDCYALSNANDCLNEPGCWWDDCVSCIADPPSSCSDYKEQGCSEDNCVVGYNPTSQGACGEIVNIGGVSYYIDCDGCAWDSNAGTNGECIQDYELREQNGQGSQQCHEFKVYGDCVGGFVDVTITTECCSVQDLGTPTGNCDPMPSSCSFGTGLHLVSCNEITETQICGVAARPLPGFSWLNGLAVIFIISIYYVFILLRKKKW